MIIEIKERGVVWTVAAGLALLSLGSISAGVYLAARVRDLDQRLTQYVETGEKAKNESEQLREELGRFLKLEENARDSRAADEGRFEASKKDILKLIEDARFAGVLSSLDLKKRQDTLEKQLGAVTIRLGRVEEPGRSQLSPR